MRLPLGPHRRYNPLLDEWVLCSPQRLDRPWQGATERVAETKRERYDAGCYLCPGNARANGARNPAYDGPFVFDNDFPALLRDAPAERVEDELMRAVTERGISRVVSFSPRHDLTLASMDTRDVRAVIDTWADETATLGARDEITHVQVFENRGGMMGCSNPHPHSQIWATQRVPTIPSRKLTAMMRHFERRRKDLLGEYLERERAHSERVVFANEHWVAIVPFWAVWPFETMVLPIRNVSALAPLRDAERDALADTLGRLARRYDDLFACEFPYSMAVCQAPTDDALHPEWRLHFSFLPPLLRSATVRKYYVGYELVAEAQRDITPEYAAERLRATSDVRRA